MIRAAGVFRLVPAVAVLTACGDGSILSPGEGSGRTGGGSGPTDGGSVSLVVTKISVDAQSAAVATPVAAPPSVRVVTREGGQLVAGVAVAFKITAGGGSVSGGDVVTTDAGGVATVGGWVLGTRAGSNSLTATAGDATAVFSATGVAGPRAVLASVTGSSQEGDVSNPVPSRPTVVVRDDYGNPVARVLVTFSVGVGGGEVEGATQLTDVGGTATVGSWTLGPTAGPNTLQAEVEGLPAVTFTVVAEDHCVEATPYAFGSTVDGALAEGDCRLWTEFTHRYSASAPEATSLRIEVASSAFSGHLSLFAAGGALVASQRSPAYCPGECTAASVRVLLPAGDYVVGAGGFDYDYDDSPVGGVTGPYSLSSTEVDEDVHGCAWDAPVFIAPGVTTTQRLEATDCVESIVAQSTAYKRFADLIWMYLTAGRTYTISMSSADFDSFVEVRGEISSGALEFNDDYGGSLDSRLTFTPTRSGFFLVRATSHGFEATGRYTLTVQ